MLLLLAFMGCYSLHAQRERRTCDIEPIIELSKDTFQSGESIPFDLLFRNNGPDKMITGDGIILVLYVVVEGERMSIWENILAGQGNDTIPLDKMASYSNRFDLNTANRTEPLTFDFCLQIASEAKVDGEDFVMAYADPNKSNDLICVKVTIMPKRVTAIAGIDAEAIEFQLYPNPACDKLYIKAEQNGVQEETQIVIRDITGRIMSTQTYKSKQMNQGPVAIDLEQFPVGLYSISLQTGKDRATKKFAVTRQ